MSQDLNPVYREYPDKDWKKCTDDPSYDILDKFFYDKEDPSNIIFLRSDVIQIEENFGGQMTIPPQVIDEEDLIKRWGISRIELWEAQESHSLGVTDSLGVLIKDFKGNKLGLEKGGCFEEVQFYFKLSDIEKLEKEYGTEPKISTVADTKKKKLRPSQLHRKRCRKVAEKLWEEDPIITIADMALMNEITEACEGIIYAESTIRRWVKDLNPNPNPGRRPKRK